MNWLDRIVALWRRQHPKEPLEELQKTASGLSRRSFLRLTGAAGVVVATGGLEVLARPMVVVPDMGKVHVFLTPELITRETMAILKKNMALAGLFNRQYQDASAVGDVVTIQKGRTIGQSGMTHQLSVDLVRFETQPQMMSLNDARQRIIEPRKTCE